MKLNISFFIIFLSLIKFSNCNDCKDYYSPEGNTCPCLYDPCGSVQCISFQDGSYMCGCDIPYEVFDGITKMCVDRDECSDGSSGCLGGCSNHENGFDCTCPAGQKLNADGKSCDIVDQCLNNDCQGSCISSGSTYYCQCPTGTKLNADGKSCDSIDPCSNSNCQGSCVASGSTYYCQCPQGSQLNADGKSCDLIDPCSNSNCQGSCIVSGSTYYCQCPSGSQLNADGKSCDLIDPCLNNNCQGSCVGSGSTYYCQCPSGSKLNADGKSCDLIDPCLNNGCEGSCVVSGSTYYCQCPLGSKLNSDGKSCDLIDPCLNNNCQGSCVVSGSTYYCQCPSGSQLNADGKSCDLIDPCLNNNCQGSCVGSGSTYYCQCPSGSQLNADGKSCDLIDPCLNNNCQGSCVVSGSTYYCQCPSGSQLNADGKSCDLIDPCLNNNCEGSCVVSGGTYSCHCPSGYSLSSNGYSCEEIDNCLPNNGGCQMKCNNLVGGFYCSCDPSYSLNSDNKTCSLITSCSNGNGGCEQICTDSGRSFNCSCKVGYTLNVDNKNCDDIDDCSPVSPCPLYSKCENQIGSYLCIGPIKHFISSITPSTTLGGIASFFGIFGDDHNEISLTISGKDCPITYIGPNLINCTAPPGVGKHSVNLTQNNVVYIGNNIYQYESLIKACPKNCTNENQGKCNTTTGECKCKLGSEGFDCSIKANGNLTTSTPPENEVTVDDGGTNISNQDTNFKIYFRTLKEIGFNGNTIKSFELQDKWKLVSLNVINDDVTNSNYVFTQTLPNTNCILKVKIEQVKKDTEFTFAETTFTVSKGLIKFTLSISNYEYSSFLNTLELEMLSEADQSKDKSNYSNDCNIKDTEIETSNDELSATSFNYIRISKNNKILGARFINRVLSDGKSTFLSTTIKNETNSIIVVLNLPHCTKECLIDPDFSLLVDPQFSECEKTSRKWVIPVSVVVSICGFATLLVLGFYFYKKNTTFKLQILKLKRINKN
ncbi:hypothetical protein RB653_004802 [Dictyostelium firmibasis]|uniref:EGF-like domain-containing protein n=1 Tax=Dictyostelium firmibasis TaxID=79012 RepID=A0AAN7U872_9MYCE